MSTTTDWITAVASLVSAAGVFCAVWQLRLTKQVNQQQFEDALEKEFRQLIAGIPTAALLDSDLDEVQYRATFDEFFRYFDLSNRQAALWKESRITSSTWDAWRIGIQFNLRLPAFARAWSEVKFRTEDHAHEFFCELRSLEKCGFSSDWPASR